MSAPVLPPEPDAEQKEEPSPASLPVEALAPVILPSQPTLTYANSAEYYRNDHDINRACNACVRAICIGPILLVLCTFLLGWNERRASCEMRAIEQGMDLVHEVGCNNPQAYEGKLVLYTCPLKKDGLKPPILSDTDWENALSYLGTGLSIKAEMMQCVETYKGRKLKDRMGGSRADYAYWKEWRDSYVDDTLFVEKELEVYAEGCDGGIANPAWPVTLPKNGAIYSPSVRIGEYIAEGDWVEQVPLELPLDISAVKDMPTGWINNGTWHVTDKFTPSNNTDIGKVRVSFNGTDWSNSTVTILGMNVGGKMERWVSKNTWLCIGFSLGELRIGNHTKREIFENMELESLVVAIILRVIGFAMAWLAFTQLLGPLELMRECIPWIGACLFESLAIITMYLACVPATACTMLVIGIVWIVMRPFLSIFLIMLTCCCGAGACFWKAYVDKIRGEDEEDFQDMGEVGGKRLSGECRANETMHSHLDKE